jgi:purine-binding chemotaxis protein CheW
MNPADAATYFVFAHRDLQYALPVLNVLEIVETPALRPFHGALSGCLGNVVHRDHLLPVLDPTALGTSRGISAAPSRSFVIVTHGDTVFGLALDRFVAVVLLPPAGAERGNGLSAGGNPFVEAVRAFRDNALVLLSPAAIARVVARDLVSQRVLDARKGGPANPRGPSPAESDRPMFLCARIDGVGLAIPVAQVNEVIEDCDVTPLFRVPSVLRGLINLRGQVLACLDLSGELGLPPRALQERNQFVVLRGDGATLALCVDRVTGIRRLAPEGIRKPDPVLSGGMARYTAGVVGEEGGALFILSVPAVFEMPALQPYRRQDV